MSYLLNPLYHIGVVPVSQDYLKTLSIRATSKRFGLCIKTAKELIMGEGISIRPNDGILFHEEMRSEVIDEAIRDYVAGMGLRAIQTKHGIKTTTMKRYLEKRGVPIRSAQTQRFPHLSEKNREQVARDFESGMFMTDIAAKCGLSKSSVKTMLRHAGIRRRSRVEIVENTEYGGMGTKDIPGYIISQWKGSAQTRGHDWSVTPEYLQGLYDQQNGKCYYTGLTLEVPAKRGVSRKRSPYRISLDRLDSSKGYILGNVVLASTFANYAKNDWPADEFESLLDQTAVFRTSKRAS